MTRILPIGLGLAGFVVPAFGASFAWAQPLADTTLLELLDIRHIPDSPEGETPVRTWTLTGAEFASIPGGLRACATAVGVGTDPEGDSAANTAFGPDGSWFVVAYRDSRNLVVYDADTRNLIREIPLSGSPSDLAVSADGLWAVTPNLFENTASIVNLASGLEVAVLPIGQAPITARITPDSSTALIGSMVDDDVAIIDLATQTELHRVPGINFGASLAANFEAWAVAFACSNPLEIADNTTAIFPDTFNDRIGFLDIEAGTVSFLASTDQPRMVTITPDGTRAVLTHAFGSSDDLDIIDVATQTVTSTIDVGTTLWGPVALNPAGTKAVVAVQNAVRVVNLGTGAVSPNLSTASVNGLITTADGQYALGIGYRGSLVSYATESLVKNLNMVVSTSIGAVSPTDTRAVMFATTFGEDMVVVDTNGSSGFLEEVRPNGPLPEGDKPRTVAVTPDGSRVLTVNQFSQNVSLFDAATMTMLGYADTGRRPGRIEVTPDGSKAVVTNRDDSFLTIIDLDTLNTHEVTISTRGDQLAISPDSLYAYVAVVVADGIWRVNLDTLSTEGAKLPTGQMGGVGYTGNQFSGMTLSNNGETLVACNSYDDTITIIDTATWTVLATVVVGDFPTTATFSPDDTRIFITNRTEESVSFVSNAGEDSTLLGTAAVGAFPFISVPNADGSTLYVLNTNENTVGVIDTATFTQTATIAVDQTPVDIIADTDNNRLLVALGTASASSNGSMTQSGQLATIETLTNTLTETLCTDHFVTDLAADTDFGLAAAAGLGGESAVFFTVGLCKADLTGDGLVNTQDMLLFLNLWTSNDPQADWNDDGLINTQDVLAYLNAWTMGC